MSLLSTRPEGVADPLVTRLQDLGHHVHAVPTVTTAPVSFEPPDLTSYDWVVVTSATGVRHLLDNVRRRAGPRWAAVGPRTAEELAKFGIVADAIPAEARGVGVAHAIRAVQPLAGLRVLLARADAAAPDLPAALRGEGASADELAVYHTVEGPAESAPLLEAALADPELAAVLFASGSAVRGLLRLANEDPRRVPAVTIGPATSEVARREGFQVRAEARRPSVEGMVSAINKALSRR